MIQLKTLNLKEILEYKQPKPTTCGNWVFLDNLTLYNQRLRYDVDLEEIVSKEDLLKWILHLGGKANRKEVDVGSFISLFCEVFYYLFEESPFLLMKENVKWKLK